MAVVGVDTGGTFTDVICWTDDGFAVVKLPSSPDNPARAVLAGLARLPVSARRVMHGSTVATNALLERRGAVTAFVTNQGFEDIIAIGRQNRPELYDLASRKEPCLVPETMSRPFLMMATLSQSFSATSSTWVEKKMEPP